MPSWSSTKNVCARGSVLGGFGGSGSTAVVNILRVTLKTFVVSVMLLVTLVISLVIFVTSEIFVTSVISLITFVISVISFVINSLVILVTS